MIALDEQVKARAFSSQLPIALAIASGVDEESEIDPSLIREAAARSLALQGGKVEEHPFLKPLLERLGDRARNEVIGLVGKLARIQFEWDESEHALEYRGEFLLDEAVRLERDRPGVTLAEYLSHIALLSEGDFESDEDSVRMMTLHAAKGLEFERVILIGMEQGNLPHRHALNKTLAEIEEERRLCYVGLTRARKRAALIYTEEEIRKVEVSVDVYWRAAAKGGEKAEDEG